MPEINRNSVLFTKTLGCLMGGLIGDAIGTPSEGKDYEIIERDFGWIDDFSTDGTDDTIMKNLLCEALIKSDGYATYDDWADTWLANWSSIFGVKVGKFFQSVLHTAVKLHRHSIPRMAPLGNMPSSSTAMCISPIGIVNACNPRQAAFQAYNVASLIHVHDVGFCQDGAVAIATAVAEAFKPAATVLSVIDASTDFIVKTSGKEMLDLIDLFVGLAKKHPQFKDFRRVVYEKRDVLFRRLACDSRETVPLALALFYLAEGEYEKTVTFAANFGRDADTIATMSGAIAGAYRGIDGIRKDWVEKARRFTTVDQDDLALKLALVTMKKLRTEQSSSDMLMRIAASPN